MLDVDGRKMSKSLGNFFTVHDKLEEGLPGEVIRMALLMTHYRDRLDWTDQRVAEARAALAKWGRLVPEPADGPVPEDVLEALADDMNTPGAIAAMHRMAAEGDVTGLSGTMALLNLRAPQAAAAGDVAPQIEALLTARAEARKAKDFGKADAIRHGLDAAGVVVMDRPGAPTEWELGPNFDAAKLAEIEE
jgi:cysteinyl-tRNA synthetase